MARVKLSKKTTALFGVSSVAVFVLAFLIFGTLNKDFSFSNDFVSRLGALGTPLALWWNLIGFALVGILLFFFGIGYGKVINDRLVGFLLSLFGIGFAFISIPIDLLDSESPVSKAHVVAVCVALAFWLFGLARLGANLSIEQKVRWRANITASLLAISMIGASMDLWSMPVTHRLVFGIVLGWTLITSAEMLIGKRKDTTR